MSDESGSTSNGASWRVGGFEVLGRIARGGTADVLLARPAITGEKTPASLVLGLVSLDQRVVLKRLYPHLAANEDFVRWFVDEVQLMSLLAHRGVVRVLDLDEDDETFFAVLELIDGPSLSAALRIVQSEGRVFPAAAAVAIVARVAEALHFVHEARDPKTGDPLELVHRDVNPQNVVVGRDGAVKLIDFGVARSAAGRRSGVLAARDTQGGLLKGKASSMSPEQLHGRPVDRRADLWGLGVTLFTLLAGRLPFVGHGDIALVQAITTEDVPALRPLRPDLPPRTTAALDEVFRHVLQKDPSARPATAEEVRATLAALLATHFDADANDDGLVRDAVISLGLPSLRA